MSPPVVALQCGVNSYPWGKNGSESLAAKLCEEGNGYSGEDGPKSQFKINKEQSYAEMWMGDYPDLPSYIKSSGKSLKDFVEEDAEGWLGQATVKKFQNHDILYPPKVLSIAKALPLQLHPNKELATELHKKDPENFTDPNHKPEIALALSKFEAFCGFKPLARIVKHLEKPAFEQFVPSSGLSSFDDKGLKSVVNKMLKADDASVKKVYKEIISSSPGDWGSEDEYIPKLAPRLAEQYSEADPGTLVALITMNYLVLQAGDSIYIPADGIHAYLAGDIIECMARSNNVLNTGFCPRAERNSADLFCDTLTFKPHTPEECMLKPKDASGKTKVYSPPLSEFDVSETKLKGGEEDSLGSVAGSRIVLVTKGKGGLRVDGHDEKISEGQSFFVKAGSSVELKAAEGTDLLVHTFYNH
ncbi:hypothetical protein AMS68_003522 [Peltaster fructicola]|uniref:Mannose-6-phosphate isomerase n=1 Tax=Peltaster fructicola TaxID=286661 RepID=A0A6H0XTN8_9PEZI|nr:hypothetical protein AMS68_003522 [Peltaster fructicola]